MHTVEFSVEKRNLYKFYTFGWDFNIMCDPYKTIKIATVKNIIRKFKNFVVIYNFKVARVAMKSELDVIVKQISDMSDEQVTPADVIEKLKKFSLKIETTIDAELKLTHAYILDEKRLGLNRLLDNIKELFGDAVFNKLSKQAQMDFMEAGKCLAFERYTASAFHILRATEEMLSVYYKHKIKQKRVKELLWYPMVKHLSGKKGVPLALMAVLDSVRLDFRNPTAHPEKFYGEDEVQKLFSHCGDIVNRIVTEVDK